MIRPHPFAPLRQAATVSALLVLGAIALVGRPQPPRVHSIPVGRWPAAVLLTGGHAVVASNGDSTVSILDLALRRVLHTVPVGDASTLAPLALALDPATQHLFVADRTDTPASSLVQMLDSRSGARLATIPVGHEATALAVDSRRGHVLVADEADGALSLLDARTGILRHTIALGLLPLALAVDERTARAFVIGPVQSDGVALPAWGDGEVVGLLGMLDTGSGALLHRTPLGSEPIALAVDPTSARVFVACTGDDTVRVLDARSGAPVRTVTLDATPLALAVDVRRGRVYVVSAAGTLSLLDAHTGLLRHTVRIDPFANVATTPPDALAVDEARDLVYLSTWGPTEQSPSGLMPQGSGMLYVLDARTGTLRRRIVVGVAPQAVAVEEGTGRVVVVNSGGVIRAPLGWLEQGVQQVAGWMPGLRRLVPRDLDTAAVPGSVEVIDPGA